MQSPIQDSDSEELVYQQTPDGKVSYNLLSSPGMPTFNVRSKSYEPVRSPNGQNPYAQIRAELTHASGKKQDIPLPHTHLPITRSAPSPSTGTPSSGRHSTLIT